MSCLLLLKLGRDGITGTVKSFMKSRRMYENQGRNLTTEGTEGKAVKHLLTY